MKYMYMYKRLGFNEGPPIHVHVLYAGVYMYFLNVHVHVQYNDKLMICGPRLLTDTSF